MNYKNTILGIALCLLIPGSSFAVGSCPDNVKNGQETDMDCGGNPAYCSTRCNANKICLVNTDCASGLVCLNSAGTSGGTTKKCQLAPTPTPTPIAEFAGQPVGINILTNEQFGAGGIEAYSFQDVKYGSGIDNDDTACGAGSIQDMDIYLPVNYLTRTTPSPVLVFFHAGGLYQGSKDLYSLSSGKLAGWEMTAALMFGCDGNAKDATNAVCKSPNGTAFSGLLEKGYVVVSVNYRLAKCDQNQFTYSSSNLNSPGVVDSKLAIEALINNAGAAPANGVYKGLFIDTSRIHVMGSSSGGVLSTRLLFDPDYDINCAVGHYAGLTMDPREMLETKHIDIMSRNSSDPTKCTDKTGARVACERSDNDNAHYFGGTLDYIHLDTNNPAWVGHWDDNTGTYTPVFTQAEDDSYARASLHKLFNASVSPLVATVNDNLFLAYPHSIGDLCAIDHRPEESVMVAGGYYDSTNNISINGDLYCDNPTTSAHCAFNSPNNIHKLLGSRVQWRIGTDNLTTGNCLPGQGCGAALPICTNPIESKGGYDKNFARHAIEFLEFTTACQ